MKWQLVMLADLPFDLCYGLCEAWQMWRNKWLIHRAVTQKVTPIRKPQRSA